MIKNIKRSSLFLIASIVLVSLTSLTSCLESDIPQYDSGYLSDDSSGPSDKSITVSGEGRVNVLADLVLVNISVVTEKPTSEEAVQENTEKANDLIDILERIDAEYIRVQTASYNLNPLYYYQDEDQPPEIYAYRVTSSIDVETTDLEKIGEIITVSIENGATDISSLRFDLSADTKEKAKRDSLKKAALDAESKASAIADALGLTLGEIMVINESGTSYPGPIYGLKSLESTISQERDLTPPVIEPQEIEVSSNMTIVYGIQ